MRKKFYRQAKKAICIATLVATVLTGIPMMPYTEAHAKGQTTTEELQALSMPTENAVTYDLSDTALRKEKAFVDLYGDDLTTTIIEINITKNGNYIIKGSNEIKDGTFADTHIKVEKGVEANIIFDGAQIHNTQLYGNEMDYYTDEVYFNQLFPVLDIEGTVNLYVNEDSKIVAPADYSGGAIEVPGNLTIKDGAGCLTVTSDMYTREQDGSLKRYAILGKKEGDNRQGTMIVEGGNLKVYGGIKELDKFVMTGGKVDSFYGYYFNISSKEIKIQGGELTFVRNENINNGFGEDETDSLLDSSGYNVYISGAKLTAIQEKPVSELNGKKIRFLNYGDPSFTYGNILSYDKDCFSADGMKDRYGNYLNLLTAEGLPENKKVESINAEPVEDLQTSEEGTLEYLFVTANNLITLDDGSVYKYDYSYNQGERTLTQDTTTSPLTCKLTFQFEDKTQEQDITVAKGFKLGEQYYDGQKVYEYYDKETGKKLPDLTGEIKVDEDMVLVLKEAKPMTTLDDKEFTEKVLPEGKAYAKSSGYSLSIAYPGDVVEEGARYTSLFPMVQKEGKWFAKVEKKEDFFTLEYWLEQDNTINILLDTDLDYSGETHISPIFSTSVDKYYGTFDGNGHSIKNMAPYTRYVVLQNNYGTIKNLCIENAIIYSSEYPAYCQSGIFCARNYGTIENCSVESSTVETRKKGENDDENTVKFRKHSALAGGNYGTIKGSFAKDITFEGDGDVYPISCSYKGSQIENTYYLSEEVGKENAKTAEQFASGEVCSLINQGVTDGSQYWHQNIDNDGERDAAPVADSSHGTVYAGYRGCVKAYSNAELPTTSPSHEIEYTAEGNTITGICAYDPSHNVQLTVSASDAAQDGKAHPVTVETEYSDEWGEEEVPYEIVYTRGENPTEDLTSPGTIKATVTVDSARVEVTYTIKAAPTATPASEPSTTPSSKPGATPSSKPGATPSSKPGATPDTKPSVTPPSKPSVTPPSKPSVTPPSKPSVTPSSKPSTTPDSKPSAASDEKPSAPAEPSKTPASDQPKQPAESTSPKSAPKGTKLEKDGNKYTVTSAAKKSPKVKYTGNADKKKKVIIPKTVTIDGVEYQVTSIDKRAFRYNTSLKEVIIGKNITKIEARAFYGCKHLRRVTFKTTTLSAGRVGTNAFGKIYKKATYVIPSKKWKNYRKWLKKRGATKQQTFQKY